jgi:FKBP-type peptidyl-prolyl cis-trans isomerase
LKYLDGERKQELEGVFRYLFVSTELAYVLYGNKPVCMLDIGDLPLSFTFSNFGKTSVYLSKFFDLLEEYKFHVREEFIIKRNKMGARSGEDLEQVLFIRRSSFLQAVNANLILFQYILGPELTAEKLLEKLLRPEETLFSALNTNSTLVGVLLGYGTQNSLFYHRQHEIEQAKQNGNVFLTPSFSYETLSDELQELEKKIKTAADFDKGSYPRVPNFGFINCKETDCILVDFRKTRDRIHTLLVGDLLQAGLSQLFDQFPDSKKFPPRIAKTFDEGVVLCALSHQFAARAHEIEKASFFDGFRSDKPYRELSYEHLRKSYMDLIEAHATYENCSDGPLREELKSRFQLLNNQRNFCFGHALRYQLKNKIDLDKVETAFRNVPEGAMASAEENELLHCFYYFLLEKQKREESQKTLKYFASLPSSVKCVYKDRLYLDLLKKGTGSKVPKNGTVTVRYTMQKPLELIGEERIATINLTSTIRGFEQGFVNQTVGSQLNLHIHPEFGYFGSFSPFGDSFLLVDVEILE